jgi:ubiquinone/menaquinone biosynthesis C-methylase UbiE
MSGKLQDALAILRGKPLSREVRDAIRQTLVAEADAAEQAIPKTELSDRHLRNLRVVPDRKAFLAAMPKGSTVAEIGVAEGEFSEQILAITQPRELHLVDSWANDTRYINLGEQIRSKFAQEIAKGQVIIHEGYSTDVLPQFPEKYFDWVYLDTGHELDMTRQELELCRRIVKPGGWITGHDYVTGYWIGWVRYGVIEAVHEFCVQYDWELMYLTHETHRHLSFAMRPIQ